MEICCTVSKKWNDAASAVEDAFCGSFHQYERLDVVVRLLSARTSSAAIVMRVSAIVLGALPPAACVAEVLARGHSYSLRFCLRGSDMGCQLPMLFLHSEELADC